MKRCNQRSPDKCQFYFTRNPERSEAWSNKHRNPPPKLNLLSSTLSLINGEAPQRLHLYTSIGDDSTILNTEVENPIIMEGTHIDCGKRITDSLIGKNVEIVDSTQNVPKGHKLILGGASKVTL